MNPQLIFSLPREFQEKNKNTLQEEIENTSADLEISLQEEIKNTSADLEIRFGKKASFSESLRYRETCFLIFVWLVTEKIIHLDLEM